MRRSFLPATCLLAALSLPSHASEQITDFHSSVDVQPDALLEVMETIQVHGEGREINHGIYRDFPTSYQEASGNRREVGFIVHGVSRDGSPEPYQRKPHVDDEVRVYIGSKNRSLGPGDFTYRLSYQTDRQLGFFADHDELYWNVTGNEWKFPIDHASASISLPAAIPRDRIQLTGYTGSQGSREQALVCSITPDGRLEFSATRALRPGEGLTIVASWPKGFIQPPNALRRWGYWLRDAGAISGLLGILLLLLYYLWAWYKVGRDPRDGTIVPLFEPPGGLSPAQVRFLREMGYDHRCLASAILSMAVKGWVTIEEHPPTIPLISKASYVLRKKESAAVLSPEETAVRDALLCGDDTFTLSQTYDPRVAACVNDVTVKLGSSIGTQYFSANSDYASAGYFIGLLLFYLTALRPRAPIMTCVLVFLIGAGIGLIFKSLLKAPTLIGRRVIDQLEGFRLFLSVSEKDRLNLLNPPARTPALFEKYLPFALALGVEQKWGEQFASAFASSDSQGRSDYSPRWYTGSSYSSFHPGNFASSFGDSVSHTIASAAAPPGSSSGGGGGGFSGGGGGGGGGGGW